MLFSRFRCRISRLRTGMTRGWGRGQMAGKTRAIAYWLLPEAAAREVFLREIKGLARQFGAPLFEPHVTIFIAPENSRAPLEVLRSSDRSTSNWRFIAFDSVNNLRRRSSCSSKEIVSCNS